MGYRNQDHTSKGHDCPQLEGRQKLGALIDYGAMHSTLHWANKDFCHAIDLDSLVDHNDHCLMYDGVFVYNCSVHGAGICVRCLFVKAVIRSWSWTTKTLELTTQVSICESNLTEILLWLL